MEREEGGVGVEGDREGGRGSRGRWRGRKGVRGGGVEGDREEGGTRGGRGDRGRIEGGRGDRGRENKEARKSKHLLLTINKCHQLSLMRHKLHTQAYIQGAHNEPTNNWAVYCTSLPVISAEESSSRCSPSISALENF